MGELRQLGFVFLSTSDVDMRSHDPERLSRGIALHAPTAIPEPCDAAIVAEGSVFGLVGWRASREVVKIAAESGFPIKRVQLGDKLVETRRHFPRVEILEIENGQSTALWLALPDAQAGAVEGSGELLVQLAYFPASLVQLLPELRQLVQRAFGWFSQWAIPIKRSE